MSLITRVKTMEKTITLYFDAYETNFGDGFYPMTVPDQSCDSKTDITYRFINGSWTQINGPTIKGYDGNTYSNIMKLLND